MLPRLPTLYPILDASVLPAGRPERARFLSETGHALAGAGIQLLQYRNKDGDDSEVLADAESLQSAHLTLILNDRVHLVEPAGFDGVHVGQGDMPPAQARALLGPGKIVGISTHNEQQLEAADTQPVDYVAFGPVFATASKRTPDPVVGLEGLRTARTLTTKPLIAIGGLSPQHAQAVLQAGADAIAVISAVFSPGATPAAAAKLAEDFLLHFRYNTM